MPFPLVVLLLAVALLLHGQQLGDPPAAPHNIVPNASESAIAKGPYALAPADWFDTSSRTVVQNAYKSTYQPLQTVPMGWTGDVPSGNPGTTAQAYRDATASRLNWFRAMAGVPGGITLSSIYIGKDQQAALMMSSNRTLNHFPPSSWTNYTAEGAEAAGNSNLCLGFQNDPGCVTLYVQDTGSNNTAVGHRRWIFYPQTRVMGTGDVSDSGSYPSANALWVFDGNYGTTRPATRDEFVAWPPRGYVPYQVLSPRWSFSYPSVLTRARISRTRRSPCNVMGPRS